MLEGKKEKNAAETALIAMQKVLTDYNLFMENNYISFSLENKKNEKATDVAPMIRHILANYDSYYDYNYINFSANNNLAGGAPVALMVRHQSQKLGPSGLPGSSPGWGAPASLNRYLQKLKLIAALVGLDGKERGKK